MSEQKKEVIKTKVGGQALIEGVMMLGPKKGCMAVRQPDREIYTEVWDRKTPKWYNKAPFIRGCINFVSQLGDGYKYLNKSGEVSGTLINKISQSVFAIASTIIGSLGIQA